MSHSAWETELIDVPLRDYSGGVLKRLEADRLKQAVARMGGRSSPVAVADGKYFSLPAICLIIVSPSSIYLGFLLYKGERQRLVDSAINGR